MPQAGPLNRMTRSCRQQEGWRWSGPMLRSGAIGIRVALAAALAIVAVGSSAALGREAAEAGQIQPHVARVCRID
jgi:hypothetical protein